MAGIVSECLVGVVIVMLALLVSYGICALLVYCGMTKKLEEEKEKEARSREMIGRATAVGPVCNGNQNEHVVGLCLVSDYNHYFARYILEIESNPADERNYKPIRVHVTPMFSFWRNETSQRPVHTGSENELRKLLQDVVERVTGIKKEEVFAPDFEEAQKILVQQNEHLFVPYATGDISSLKEQFRFYGRPTLDMARNHILGNTPEWKEPENKSK